MTTLTLVPPAPRIAVEREGSGPFLIFLHGIGGNRSNWRDQLPVFAERFTAAAWDARGYGGSDDYEGPLAFGDFAQDLKRVLDHFGVGRAHIVGLSMGGRIAMSFALLHPARVATLTLADTHPGFAALAADQRQQFLESRRAPLLAGKDTKDIAPGVARALAGPHATAEQIARLEASIASLRKASYLKSLDATVNQDGVLDIARIAAPTHFVVGEHDRLSPPSLTREMAAKVKGAEVTVIPGAGHLSNIEKPADFDRAVLDFLRQHV